MSLRKSRALPIKPPPRGIDLPCDDGEPMETGRHRQQMDLLIGLLSEAWIDRRDYFVGGNMFVYYSELQAKRNDFRGPDFFVVLDTEWNPDRRSWVVWEENGRVPDVVIELISESTEAEDRGVKMDIYAKLLRVSEYYLFDPWDQRLEGYSLDTKNKVYEPMLKDEHGRYWSSVLKLFLGIVRSTFRGNEVDWLRFLDAQGCPIALATETAQVQTQRAEAEAQRAETEARRADLEKLEKDVERRRADAEAARADAEALRANEALAKLAEYERLLGKK